MTDEILTVAAVAKLLKVADKRVYTMAVQGEITCFRVRRPWRFRQADLESWIERCSATMPADGEKQGRR